MNIKKVILVSILALGMGNALGAVEGDDYTVMAHPVPQTHPDKVEVLEFFAYWCPHCKDLEPVFHKQSKKFAKDTYTRIEHVVWDKQRDGALARLAAAINQSGEHKANTAVFNDVVEKNLISPEAIKAWLAQQTTFDNKKVLAAFESFGSASLAKQMEDNTKKYNVTGTPIIIVGGKYQVNLQLDHQRSMRTLMELIDKVRQERGLKAPAPNQAPKAKGMGFIQAPLKH